MKRTVLGLAALAALIVGCAQPPKQDPNPKPDHGVSNTSKACPRSNLNTICVEFYANTATSLKVRVTGLNGLGEAAEQVTQIINVYPGGGSVGFTLPLDQPPVSITGRAVGPPGIKVGCRVLVRGLEIPVAGTERSNGEPVVCKFTTS